MTAGPLGPELTSSGKSKPSASEVAQPRRRLGCVDIGQHDGLQHAGPARRGCPAACSTAVQRIEIAAELVQQGGDLDVDQGRVVVAALHIAVQPVGGKIEIERARRQEAVEAPRRSAAAPRRHRRSEAAASGESGTVPGEVWKSPSPLPCAAPGSARRAQVQGLRAPALRFRRSRRPGLSSASRKSMTAARNSGSAALSRKFRTSAPGLGQEAVQRLGPN